MERPDSRSGLSRSFWVRLENSMLGVCSMQSQTSLAPSLHYERLQDKNNPEDWRVECIDSKSGDVFVAIFCGPLAQERALEYVAFKNNSGPVGQ